MRFYELGMIVGSNKYNAHCGFLSVSKINYDIICREMNVNITKDFKKYKHCFLYGLYEYDKGIDIQGDLDFYSSYNLPKLITDKRIEVKVFASFNNSWKFNLVNIVYEPAYKITVPNMVRSFE